MSSYVHWLKSLDSKSIVRGLGEGLTFFSILVRSLLLDLLSVPRYAKQGGGTYMIFAKSKENVNLGLQSKIKAQADKLGITDEELIALGKGKSCPKYGNAELLHTRKVKGGKIVVFNISEKFRGEKISIGRKKLKRGSNPGN